MKRPKPETPLGAWIRDMRKQKELSLREAASLCHIHYTYLSKIETGRCIPGRKICMRIAKGLDLARAHLITLLNFAIGSRLDLMITSQQKSLLSEVDADMQTRVSHLIESLNLLPKTKMGQVIKTWEETLAIAFL